MLLIADLNDKSGISNLLHLPWVYIGDNRNLRLRYDILDQTKRIFIGKYIENITEKIRHNFVDFIGSVSAQQKDKVLWYSSRMASKATSQTSMFHQYVYLKLIEMFLEKQTEDLLVICDDIEFFYNVNKVFSGRVKILKKKIPGLKYLYTRWRGYAKITKYCCLWIFYRFFKNNKINIFDVLIHSWIDGRVFKRSPDYNDSYFGDLEKVLKKNGYSVARLTPLRISPKNAFKLNRNFNNIIYPLSYVSLRDFLKGIFAKFTVVIKEQGFATIKDRRILTLLLENEICKENSTKVFLDYLLCFYAYEGISPVIKYNANLIYPFENQPWEKMFNLGFSRFNRIAYQHTVIYCNRLEYYNSRYEQTPLPNTILTAGKRWSSFLKEQRYATSLIKEAGAIRFQYLFNERKKEIDGKYILLALPLSPTISISLQRQLLNLLEKDGLKDYIIKIKPHPYLKKRDCLTEAFAVYKNCEFVKTDVSELLKECLLLITSASAVAFESLSLGIKTLYLVPEEISWDLEYFIKDELTIAYENDFDQRFKEIFANTCRPRLDLQSYFSYPDYEVFIKSITSKE